MSQTLPSKEMEELRQRFRAGYSVRKTKGGHFEVLDPRGEVVRTEKNLPVKIPGTPHGGRQTKNVEASLKAAGVLKRNGTPTRRIVISQNGREARAAGHRAAMSLRNKNRQEVADALFNRLNPLVEQVGGFQLPGMAADLAYIGAQVARDKGLSHM